MMSHIQENPVREDMDERIHLKVVKDESEIYFRIKKTTPMNKLMDAYCQRHNLSASTVRFTFGSRRIYGSETAEQLEMKDQDIINTVVHLPSTSWRILITFILVLLLSSLVVYSKNY